MIWLSASRLKSFDLCPSRSQIREPQTPAMALGTRRHKYMERWYLDGVAPVAEATQDEAAAQVAAALERQGFAPDRSWAIDVEGNSLPPSVAVVMYDRPMGQLRLNDRFGLRFVADLIYLHPESPDTLRIADWKGSTQEDHAIQAAVYFWAYSHPELYGDMARFVFEARSVTTGAIELYAFDIEQRADVEAMLTSMCERIADAKEFPPKLNRWCDSCPISATCTAYTSAVATIPIVSAPDEAKTYQLPSTFSGLIEMRERLQVIESVAGELRFRIDGRIKQQLEQGPVQLDGKTWKLVERTTRYDVDTDSAVTLCDHIGVKLEEIVTVDHPKYKVAVEQRLAKLKKDKSPEYDRVLKWFEESRKARKSSIITHSQSKEAA